MATKKAAAKKAIAPAKKTAAKSTSKATTPAQAAEPASASKMTKTQVVRHMAERLEMSDRQGCGMGDQLGEAGHGVP